VPDINSREGPTPDIVANLRKARYRGKHKVYGPNDMWTLEDNLAFLKYCPDPKMKCYHAIAIDTGARPHEILL
jgi:integrase/recombinase XerD